MKKNILSFIFLCVIFLTRTNQLAFAQTTIQVTLSATSVPTYDIEELKFSLPNTYSNPYDPAVIDAYAFITDRDGVTKKVTAFWYESIQTATTGSDRLTIIPNSGVWKVRFAPTKTGTYSYRVEAKDTTKTYASATGTFTATGSSSKGFVQADPQNKTRLMFDTGSAFVPIGTNLAWAGVNDFANSFATYKQNKLNFARIWMSYQPDPHFLLEWSGTANKDNNALSWVGLGKYNQENAYKLDNLLISARDNDVYLMLTIFTYQYFFDWAGNNPYQSTLSNGDVRTFWTSQAATKYYKNYVRYIGARYAAFTNLALVELWNELDKQEVYPGLLTNGLTIMGDWHRTMIAQLKDAAPRNVLATTSFSGYAKQGTDGTGTKSYNSIPTVDVTQAHHYDSGGNASNMVQAWFEMAQWANRTFDKPWFIGEYGYHGFDCYKQTIAGKCSDNTTLDWQLEKLNHHATWVPIMLGGASGSNLLWRVNWSFVPPQEFLPNYKIFGTWIEPELPYLRSLAFTYADNTTYWSGGYKGTNRALLYFLNKDAKWTVDETTLPGISGASYQITGLNTGNYTVQYTNPMNGSLILSTTASPTNGTMSLQLPAFKRDLAVKVTPSGVTTPTDTPQPTATPTGTAASTTPFYLRSDFGGIGGQKDGKVDIQDYNILAGEFYKTLPAYKANIIDTGLSAGKVDVQDYNAFVSDFLAYLAR